MFTFNKPFTEFAQMMDNERIWLDPGVTFAAICRTLGVSARRFDRFLTGELGWSGEEILHIYRTSAYKKD